MSNVRINRKMFTRQLYATARNREIAKKKVRSAVQEILNERRVEFLKNLDEHPVTKEIKAGPKPTVKNKTGLLGGYGNLFSFIGFPQGSDPIGYLKSFFVKSRITRVSLTSISKGKFFIESDIPTKEEIYSDPETHIRWEPGRSWLDGIEQGISGLGQYIMARNQKDRIASLKTGGSGEAIQLKSKDGSSIQLRPGRMRPTAYFSRLYRNFIKSITRKL